MLSTRTSPNLVLAPNALQEGLTYQFRLDIITPYGSAFAVLSVTPNLHPFGGVFSIFPSSGVALATPFLLQSNGWSSYDQSALRYSFAYPS